jgi:hypothetical protein
MMIRPHFLAQITLRHSSDGGRTTTADLSRYRPDIRFPFDGEFYYGAHFLPNAGSLAPGETKDLDIQIRNGGAHVMSRVVPGLEFLLVEGPRPVADGKVIAVHRIDE